MKHVVLCCVFVLASAGASAESLPRPTSADARIRQVAYSATEVYELTGSYRLTTTIEFERGETVQYLTLGDTIAWQAHAVANRVHLKPVEPRAVTNLTVITDRRAYYFRLTANSPKEKQDATYLLRFNYAAVPEIAVNPQARYKTATAAADTETPAPKPRSCNYSVAGSRSIKLIRACDDGFFTYLEFAADATLPAFYTVEADGSEAAVNYRIEGKYVVVERLASLYTLREGSEALCLFADDRPLQTEAMTSRTMLRQRTGS